MALNNNKCHTTADSSHHVSTNYVIHFRSFLYLLLISHLGWKREITLDLVEAIIEHLQKDGTGKITDLVRTRLHVVLITEHVASLVL